MWARDYYHDYMTTLPPSKKKRTRVFPTRKELARIHNEHNHQVEYDVAMFILESHAEEFRSIAKTKIGYGVIQIPDSLAGFRAYDQDEVTRKLVMILCNPPNSFHSVDVDHASCTIKVHF